MGRETNQELNVISINTGLVGNIVMRWFLLLFVVFLGFPWVSAFAEASKQSKQEAALQQVLRKAQGALLQLSQEKTQLEADKAALQEQVGKLDATVKELEPLKGEVEKQKAAVEAMKKTSLALEGQITSGNEREQQLRDKLKQIIAQARLIQGDNQLLVAAVKEREQWIGQCQQKNKNMAALQSELIQRYQDKGFWDKIGDIEPFTGIGKVKTENAVQDYQFKLEDLKATPFQSELKPAAKEGTAEQEKKFTPLEEDDGE